MDFSFKQTLAAIYFLMKPDVNKALFFLSLFFGGMPKTVKHICLFIVASSARINHLINNSSW